MDRVKPTSIVTFASCALLLGLSQAHGQQPALPEAPVIYEGATLIVGDLSTVIEDAAFVVETGRFTRVGRRGEIQAPPGATRVDLTGKTVMPAIINAHQHPSGGGGSASRESFIRTLELHAYVGTAAITSMGRDGELAFQLRWEALPNTPQLLTSGRGVVYPLGRHPQTIADYEAGRPSRMPENLSDRSVWVETETQARMAVEDAAVRGVDFLKIWVDDRLGTEIPMPPNIYRVLIEEAHRRHIPVFAHMFDLEVAKGLVRAGVDHLAHPVRNTRVDDELIQLLLDRPNVYMQTNLYSTWMYTLTENHPWYRSYFDDPFLLEMAGPQAVANMHARVAEATQGALAPRIHEGQRDVDPVEESSRVFANIVYNTRTLYDAGVKYAFGTDAGAPQTTHLELEILVRDVGLTPLQAINMATQSSAMSLGLEYLGTIEPGKDASFIVLNANPLEDITNTRRISQVFLRGKEVDREGIRQRHLNFDDI